MSPADRRSGAAVAVIPARGGSQGVKGKNLVPIGGIPLVVRAVVAARESEAFDRVFVTTDHEGIAAAATEAGATAIQRPADLATGEASSESALLHAAPLIEEMIGAPPAVLGFLQATSPFIAPAALASAVERVRSGEVDSLFSAVAVHEFLWRITEAGARGVNHDYRSRPRRQDREQEFRETGAFYVMAWDGFLEHRHRFFGRVGLEEVEPATAIEIDEPADVDLARALAHIVHPVSVAFPRESVAAVVTDFDGVHTDDTVVVDQDGRESVRVNRGDGMGIAALVNAGIPFLILSKERNPVVNARAAKLGVEVLSGVDDKAAALTRWATDRGVALSAVVYVGNDVNDLPAMALVGIPVAVADAREEVARASRIVLSRGGGHGAIREIADLILDGAVQASNPPEP